MATANLSATPRSDAGKGVARTLRAAGRVPAVIYGHSRESQALSIPTRDLEKLLDRVSAETTVIELDIDGKMSRTLIREIQRHPFKRQILHVDFQELVAGEKVTVNIPLVLVGMPAVLEMFHFNQLSGVCAVRCGDQLTAEVGFQDGEIVSASTSDGLAGAEAVFRLLSWPGGRFAFALTHP